MTTKLTSLIDHTLLKADAREEQVTTLVQEAKEYKLSLIHI